MRPVAILSDRTFAEVQKTCRALFSVRSQKFTKRIEFESAIRVFHNVFQTAVRQLRNFDFSRGLVRGQAPSPSFKTVSRSPITFVHLKAALIADAVELQTRGVSRGLFAEQAVNCCYLLTVTLWNTGG
jgi:hypothetical protein